MNPKRIDSNSAAFLRDLVDRSMQGDKVAKSELEEYFTTAEELDYLIYGLELYLDDRLRGQYPDPTEEEN